MSDSVNAALRRANKAGADQERRLAHVLDACEKERTRLEAEVEKAKAECEAWQEAHDQVVRASLSPPSGDCSPRQGRSEGLDRGELQVANVRDFGAKGDGVTDDTEAFQKAVDDFEESYG